MANFSLEKIEKEVQKGTLEQQLMAYEKVKKIVSESLIEHQREAEEKANDLQQKLDRINGA